MSVPLSFPGSFCQPPPYKAFLSELKNVLKDCFPGARQSHSVQLSRELFTSSFLKANNFLAELAPKQPPGCLVNTQI